jgi:hypothetical protein
MKLSLEDASYLRRVLLTAGIFQAVLLQRGETTQEVQVKAPRSSEGVDRVA